jgi:L-methionine (R)-S-oxide reductase
MTNNDDIFSGLLAEIKGLTMADIPRDVRLMNICLLLNERVPHYNWVGFYLVDQTNERELILGPYVGAPTDHVRIPFGKGICGQAAEREEIFVVDDVTKESNYLSCSINVKSEIVLPIFRNKQILGELDIDSHTPAAFTEHDRKFLNSICEMVAGII